jgi:hypothetical protein
MRDLKFLLCHPEDEELDWSQWEVLYTSIIYMILVYDIISTIHSIILLYHSLMYCFLEFQCKYVYKLYLSLIFLVIRVMIQYHIMIILHLSLLIDVSHQLFC